jgi:hypothetical protein
MRRLPRLVAPRVVPAMVVAAVLVPAPPAVAVGPEIGIADDRVLISGGPAADRAVASWRALGVDTVRIFASWSRIAPAPTARRRPAGFDAADPHSPHYAWSALDAGVDRVRAAGMQVTLTITGPGPLWSSAAPRRGEPTYRPRPSAYAAFARAVAGRYGDRVDRYILWNEPNIPTWLRPQAKCSRGRCTPVAPHLYRGLVRAAYPAVRAADPGAQVLIGTLSPRGGDLRRANSTMRPLAFLRAFGCRTARFTRAHTGACRGFRPATGDGFAFHPHGALTAPDRPLRHPDDVNIAELDDLQRTLGRLQRQGALRATTYRFGIYIDEYGYQTRPPDPAAGVRPRTQDQWLQRAAYVAWRNPRVKLLTQYLWRDEPRGPNGTFGGWQSGLLFAGGRPKPSLAHFDTPFVLDAARSRLWGQVRPGGAHSVLVQRRVGGGAWREFARVTTDARGYWSLKRRLTPGASYRYQAAGATSAVRRR